MLKMLNYMIVDDEPLAIDVIENYLGRLDVHSVTRCENAIDAFQALQNSTFHVIFLDIEMPLLSGIEFLKSLREPPLIIITTAYRDYAVEGFELEVVDYLVKPISFPRWMKAMEKVVKHYQPAANREKKEKPAASDYLFLKVDRKFVKVLVNDILYIESLKDYIRVKTSSQALISYQSLTDITDKLPAEKFVRVHRSYTIAIDKVSMIDGNCVEVDGKLIPISREHRQEVMEKIYK